MSQTAKGKWLGPICFVTALAAAPPLPPADIWTAAQFAEKSAHLATIPGNAHTRIAGIGNYSGYEMLVEWRGANGEAELHEHADDLLIVQSGESTLVSGGELDAPHMQTPGELRGSSIRGGHSEVVHAGDVIRVPAGTPHQFFVAAGANFTVLAIKVRR